MFHYSTKSIFPSCLASQTGICTLVVLNATRHDWKDDKLKCCSRVINNCWCCLAGEKKWNKDWDFSYHHITIFMVVPQAFKNRFSPFFGLPNRTKIVFHFISPRKSGTNIDFNNVGCGNSDNKSCLLPHLHFHHTSYYWSVSFLVCFDIEWVHISSHQRLNMY